MTLRDVITEKRKEFWKEADTSQMGEELELVIDRLDEIGELVDRLEIKLINLSASATQPSEVIPSIPEEVLQDAIEVFKATIAEKKRELATKVVPMKSWDPENPYDLSATHDFTGPGKEPED